MDNAVAESFFSSLKRERIRRRTYRTREKARQDVFNYIDMFYNPVRKQVTNGMLSPVEFERQRILKAEGVQKSRGYSTARFTSSATASSACLATSRSTAQSPPDTINWPTVSSAWSI
jgi:hypothetical protein